jgi:hypothetical protein
MWSLMLLLLLQVVVAQEYEVAHAPRADFCTDKRPAKTYAAFINDHHSPLTIYWYEDETGSCQGPVTQPTLHFGMIEPNETRLIATEEGHVFRMVDFNQTIIRCAVASFKK